MKKILSVFLISVCVLALIGCNLNSEINGSTISGTVKITGPEEEVILDAKTYVSTDKATADKAVIKACSGEKLPYTYESGMFDGFDGIKSEMEDGWLLYINGKLAEVGAALISLEEGFEIEFIYVNYSEAFALE